MDTREVALLDLRAVEARLHEREPGGSDGRISLDDADALLAHCRALRAALSELAGPCDNWKWGRCGYCVRCVVERKAAAVLAQAQDGPA